MKICLIAVIYNESYLCSLSKLYESLTKHIDSAVIVNNSNLIKTQTIKNYFPQSCIIQGTNNCFDFSGYQEGLDFSRSHFKEMNWYLFVNDSVMEHRVFTNSRLKSFLRVMLEKPENPSYLGFTDKVETSSEFFIDNLVCSEWVSTYMFAMNPSALTLINWKIYDKEFTEASVWITETSELSFSSRRVSFKLIEHIQDWLFNGKWYRSHEEGIEKTLFLTKTRCILSEKLLSAKANNIGIKVIDPLRADKKLYFIDKFIRLFMKVVRKKFRA